MKISVHIDAHLYAEEELRDDFFENPDEIGVVGSKEDLMPLCKTEFLIILILLKQSSVCAM